MDILKRHELDLATFNMPSMDDPLAKFTNVAIFKDIQEKCNHYKAMVALHDLDIEVKVRSCRNEELMCDDYIVYASSREPAQIALLKINI